MGKVRCPVSEHGVIERAYEQVGGLDEAAVILTRGKSWLYGTMNPDREAQKAERLSYADARALVRAGGLALAEDLARLCGMQLVPIEADGTTAPLELMGRLSTLMTETGEAVTAGAAALVDGKFDRHEIHTIRTQVIDVLSAANGILKDLEGKTS